MEKSIAKEIEQSIANADFPQASNGIFHLKTYKIYLKKTPKNTNPNGY